MKSDKIKMNLQCPMPKLDFDIITMGHGSGGLLTNKLLETGVFELLKNDLLDEHMDGARFSLDGPLAFSTDSYVITPVFFPGGNIGELAVNGTINDLAMCGARPRYLSLALIIEEGLSMRAFWDIIVSVKFAAEAAGVQVVTGDTKVVERGKGDHIFINTSGIGQVHPDARLGANCVKAGDKIILSGPVATHGIAIMRVREGLEFETDIESDTCALHFAVQTLLDRFGPAVHLMRDPTRGGVAMVLNEIARDCRLGVDILEKNIPVLDAVQGGCELLGLDPLYVANEGVFIAIVEAARADEILQTLRTDPCGAHAAIIGEVVETHPRQVVLQSKIGGKRVVNMPLGEQLPRIC